MLSFTADIVQRMRWIYVSVLYTPDRLDQLQTLARNLLESYNVGVSLQIELNGRNYHRALDKVTDGKDGTSGVLVLADPETARSLFGAADEYDWTTKCQPLWIFVNAGVQSAESMYHSLNLNTKQTLLTVGLRSLPDLGEQFVVSFSLSDRHDSWVGDVWQQYFVCSLRNSNLYARACTGSEELTMSLVNSQNEKTTWTMIAVLGIAEALRRCRENAFSCTKMERDTVLESALKLFLLQDFASVFGTHLANQSGVFIQETSGNVKEVRIGYMSQYHETFRSLIEYISIDSRHF